MQTSEVVIIAQVHVRSVDGYVSEEEVVVHGGRTGPIDLVGS